MTLVHLLRALAYQQADHRVFTFLSDGETREEHLTFGELDRQATAIAARLQKMEMTGQRALLLYPSGLEYLSAFFGCLYAGVTAVPAYPARLNKPAPRIDAIVADAGAAVALTTAASLRQQEGRMAHSPKLEALKWIATDEVVPGDDEKWTVPHVTPETLAFLQYTSGSTGTPRGVMVSHANLLHNLEITHKRLGTTSQERGVFWLPFYHDMGLIGALLQTIYCSGSAVLMSPVHFLQRPVRWLQAISRYQANFTAAPNFAYDLCVRKVTPEMRADLDLSSLRVALNGAEPVRAESLDRFAEAFASCGFKREAFYPSYGLAEATLFVTGGVPGAAPVVRDFTAAGLEQNQAILVAQDSNPVSGDDRIGILSHKKLVGCGHGVSDQQVVIVNAETMTECEAARVGEICVSGPSVAGGYWNRPEDTTNTFGAKVVGRDGSFLRTGDLGFVQGGELFVTGRLKDLIIIRGSNHYPQDIERTVEASHPALMVGGAAAFAVDVEGEEQLVVAVEMEREKRHADVTEVTKAVRQALSEQHELAVHAVLLLKPGALPRTSSGKVQRHACKIGYAENSLETVGCWCRTNEVADTKPQAAPTAAAIQTWLVEQLARRLGVKPHDVNVREPFARYGLDSAAMVDISGELETWLGRRLSPSLGWEYPTIEALSRHLAETPDGVAATLSHKLEAEGEPIAIIGMSCRFPGAGNVDAFWKLVRDGVDAVTEVPKHRWNSAAYYDPNPAAPGKVVTRWGGFVDGVDKFDAAFFDISPREASRMDPQQRLLLETAWEALEDAGQSPEKLSGEPVGVYVGIFDTDYARVHISDPRTVDAYGGTGNAYSIAANRLSYYFGFRGPSLAVDTACSSALVALHLACQSIQNGESKMAVVGGVNVIVGPYVTMTLSKGGFMSPDGRCKSFGDNANGYVRSDGVGVVVLKPLSQALADGDPIHAVIRGSAVNNDGRSNGLTAPSRQAQEILLRDALRRAGKAPSDIDYVEAHGTGTSMGDLIESLALGTVLGQGREPGDKLTIGSVKSNIGHTEPAAGMASLIKLVLSLKNRMIPPSLHSKELNPNIPWDELPLVVNQELKPLTAKGDRAVGGVSAFGFGGTNAHFIVEEAPARPETTMAQEPDGSVKVLPLSAKSGGALRHLAKSYAEMLTGDNGLSLTDVCHTAGLRRDHHAFRKAFVGRTAEELRAKLEKFSQGDEELTPSVRKGAAGRPKVVFVFAGQGNQFVGMGRQLLESQPVFKAKMEECDAVLRPLTGWSLIEEILADESASRLEETEVAQPVLFAMQVSLAEVWKSLGVTPDAVVGHSMGEVSAAYVSGSLSLADAAKVVYHRSRLMQRATGLGGMAALELPPAEVEEILARYPDQVSLAAANGPTSFVLAGQVEALDAIVAELKPRGVFAKVLTRSYAFHSPQMDGVCAELVEALKDIEAKPATVTVFSTVTGREAQGTDFDAGYWGRQVREAVRFSTTIDGLCEAGHDLYLEVGPHPVLCRSIQECARDRGQEATALPSLKRREDDTTVIMESLAGLYGRGFPLDWSRLCPDGKFVSLPKYPWQHQRHWMEESSAKSGPSAAWGNAGTSGHPLLSSHLRSANRSGTSLWETEVDRLTPAFIDDHKVQGAVVVPGTTYVEMALAAGREMFGSESPAVLTGLTFHQMLMLPQGVSRRMQVSLSPRGRGEFAFEVNSRPNSDGPWTLHATGKVGPAAATEEVVLESLDEIRGRCELEIPAEYYYPALEQRGLIYGPTFRSIQKVWRREGESLGELVVPEAIELGSDAYHLHPAVLDACLQAMAAAVSIDAENGPSYLPIGMGRVTVRGKLGKKLYSHTTLHPDSVIGEPTMKGDLRLLDEEGRVVVEIEGLRLGRLDTEQAAMPMNSDDWLYEVKWEAVPLAATERRDEPKSWLVFADAEFAPAVCDQLTARGETVVVVTQGDEYAAVGNNYRIDVTKPDDYRRMMEEVRASGGRAFKGVVHAWGLKQVEDVDAAQRLGCLSILHVVQAMAEVGVVGAPRLYLVTRNAQAVGSEAVPGFAQSPIWGMARVLGHEQPHLHCTVIDLDAETTPEALTDELMADDREDMVAYRGGVRQAARLARSLKQDSAIQTVGDNYRLEVTSDAVTIRSASRPAAGPQEIVIEVMAASLGTECSGRVVAVGEDVQGFGVGLEVVAVTESACGAFARANASMVVAKPAHLSFEEAAALPLAFVTARHALLQVARLGRGEKVLVHGTDAVAMAAVQVARSVGAEVIGGADAESLDFSEQVLALTSGQGVDVVLNCEAGDLLSRAATVMAAYGRFVDVAASDDETPLDKAFFRKSLSFTAVDVERLRGERPAVFSKLLRDVVDRFEEGVYQPLPITVVPVADASRALRTAGKVVVSMTERPEVIEPPLEKPLPVRADGSYLITGGLGGLGLKVARWLAENGARYLVLSGRSAPSAEAEAELAALRLAGIRVLVVRGDVSRSDDVARMLGEIDRTMPPLRGIVHSAGVLDEGVMLKQTEERFLKVLAPKVAGTWRLHEQTLGRPLDFFVLFSSMAAVFGSPGQGNYAAGNAFLDGLAHHRRSLGLPATSINWGAWAEVGMAARMAKKDRRALNGLGDIPVESGVKVFGELLRDDPAQVCVVPVMWQQWMAAFPMLKDEPLLNPLATQELAATRGADDGQARSYPVRDGIVTAADGERQGLLETHLQKEVARVLGLQASQVELTVPLTGVGLDSLMVIELKNRIETSLGLELQMMNLLQGPSIRQWAGQLLPDLIAASGAAVVSGEPVAEATEELEPVTAE